MALVAIGGGGLFNFYFRAATPDGGWLQHRASMGHQRGGPENEICVPRANALLMHGRAACCTIS